MKIPEKLGSKYRFIVLAGNRVSQLQKGAKSRLENTPDKMKMTQVAIHELAEERLDFVKQGEAPPQVDETEVAAAPAVAAEESAPAEKAEEAEA